MRILVPVAVCAALIGAAFVAPSHAAYSDNFDCVWRTGPPYVLTYGTTQVTKRIYNISGFKLTCSYAKKWINRLARQPYAGAYRTLRGGPPGYRCQSRVISRQLKPRTVWNGVCQNKRHTEIVFDWTGQ